MRLMKRVALTALTMAMAASLFATGQAESAAQNGGVLLPKSMEVQVPAKTGGGTDGRRAAPRTHSAAINKINTQRTPIR